MKASRSLAAHRIYTSRYPAAPHTQPSRSLAAKFSGSETPSISSKKNIYSETSHRFQYSGEFLKSLDSFQTIARATPKALFRNKIWKSKHDRTPVIVANRRKLPTLSPQRGVRRMRSDKVNKEVIVKPKENTIPVIIGNRKLPSRSKWRGTSQNSSLIQVTQDGTAEDKPGNGHIKVCTVNTQSIRNKTWDVVCFQTRLIYAQWQKHGWTRPKMPLNRNVSLLAIHPQIILAKVAGWVAALAYYAGQISHHLWCDQERTNHLSSLNGS